MVSRSFETNQELEHGKQSNMPETNTEINFITKHFHIFIEWKEKKPYNKTCFEIKNHEVKHYKMQTKGFQSTIQIKLNNP